MRLNCEAKDPTTLTQAKVMDKVHYTFVYFAASVLCTFCTNLFATQLLQQLSGSTAGSVRRREFLAAARAVLNTSTETVFNRFFQAAQRNSSGKLPQDSLRKRLLDRLEAACRLPRFTDTTRKRTLLVFA